jgi:GTPase SAR1 family protein
MVKLVFLGDMKVGKTAAISTYVEEVFPSEHNPTIFDTYKKEININKIVRDLTIHD